MADQISANVDQRIRVKTSICERLKKLFEMHTTAKDKHSLGVSERNFGPSKFIEWIVTFFESLPQIENVTLPTQYG